MKTTEPTTRDALLHAARALFAERGYDGISVRDITAAADANLGAITYHFGSKHALYEQVVAACLEELTTRLQAVLASTADPLDRAEDVVRTYFDYFSETPEVPRLMLQELARGFRPLPASVSSLRDTHQALTRLVREGQAQRRIRAGVPEIMAMSIVSQPIHLMFVREMLRAFAVDPMAPGVRERVIANATAFARAGLEERGP